MQDFGPFTYRIAEAEAVAAARAVMRKRLCKPPIIWLIIAIVVTAASLLLLDALDGFLNVAGTAALVAALPAVWLVLVWIVPYQARRQYRQSAALRDENTMSFDEEAITFASRRGAVRIPLAEFHGFTEAGDLIVLHQTEMFYNLVPRRALGEAGDALVSRLEAAGIRRV